MERATKLLVDIVGGEVGPVFEVRNDSHQRSFEQVSLKRERLVRFLGVAVADDKVGGLTCLRLRTNSNTRPCTGRAFLGSFDGP